MTRPQRSRIQALLTAEASPLRAELLRIGFDALIDQPLSVIVGHPELPALIVQGMAREPVERLTNRHVLPGVARVHERLARAEEKVGDLLSKDAEVALRKLVVSGKGPRFKWLRGAVDPGDIQKLIAPIVQHVLTSFVAKLPIPGMPGSGGGGGGGGGPGRASGLVGMIGKQMAKGASQLAGGLGLQQIVRDFSESAAAEIRHAIADRLRSEDGRKILHRIRERVLDRVLAAKVGDVVADFLRVPAAEVAKVAEGAVSHTRTLPVFREILEGEIKAVLDEIGARSLHDVLEEDGQLESMRAIATAAVAPGLVALVRTDAFGEWLERLLAQSG